MESLDAEERGSFSDLRLDEATRSAVVDGRSIRLTPSEFGLLVALVRAGGETVSRDDLLREIWRSPWNGPSRTVDVHVADLRRKLGDVARSPRWIATVRGRGFRLCASR
jgi:two-component system, OmpR family, KDP operon response regulator KdpE